VNDIYVRGTDGPLYLTGSSGSQSVDVGVGSTAGIGGAVDVYNSSSSGYSYLTIDDSSDTTGQTANLYDGWLTGLGAPAPIYWTPLSSATGGVTLLEVSGGWGDNTFDVYGTSDLFSGTFLSTGGGLNAVSIVAATGALDVIGSGSDTLVGPNGPNTWDITGSDFGSLGVVEFTGVANLTGGTANDTFDFGSAGSVTGTIRGGGGTNTLNYSGDGGAAATVNLATGAATRTGGFSNIQVLVGSSSAADMLVGPNSTNTWTIIGANAGTVGAFSFSAVETLTGGTGLDEFVFSAGAAISGKIDGGSANGNDWLDYAAYATAVMVNLATDSATGVEGGAAGGIANIRNVRGGHASNALTGNSLGNILIGGAGNNTITGGNGRSILIADKGTSTITGGSADDIVIGGYTSYDGSGNANDLALMAIMAEWQSSDSYATRVAKIKAGVAGGAKFVLGTTVFSNGQSNSLNGGGGKNWIIS
jgi:hypothetical protein